MMVLVMALKTDVSGELFSVVKIDVVLYPLLPPS